MLNRTGIRAPSLPSHTFMFNWSRALFLVPIEIIWAPVGFPSSVRTSTADGRSENTYGCDSQKTATRVSLIGLFASRLGFRLNERAAYKSERMLCVPTGASTRLFPL